MKSPADWHEWRYETTHGYMPEEAWRFRSGAPEDPVRTALDDELMTVAKSYSDARRVGDEGAIRASEQALSELLERANLERFGALIDRCSGVAIAHGPAVAAARRMHAVRF